MFKKLLRLVIVSFSIVSLLQRSYSQNIALVFKHITIEDGLSNSNINCIIQDSEGLIWFGTEDGLNKFDGRNFTHFGKNYNTPNFSGNYIFEMIEDSDQNLWIAAAFGLTHYNRMSGKFYSYLPNTENSKGIKDQIIRCIIEDHEKKVWFGTKSGRLNIYDKTEDSIYVFKNTKGEVFNQDNIAITDLFEDNLGNIWVLYISGNTIDVINKERDSVFRINLSDENIENKQSIAQRRILQDKNQNYWIATMGNGLIKLERTGENTFSKKRFVHDPNNPNSLPGNSLLTLWADVDSGIWLGIENVGLSFYDPDKNSFTTYTSDLKNPGSLSHQSVWSIFQDNNKGLWVGTFSTGINYSNDAPKIFQLVQNNPLDNHSLSNNIVSSFFIDKSGNLWVGTSGGGLNMYDFETKEFHHYNTSNSKLSSDAIKAIYEDKKRNIWIATWGGGINVFNPKTNVFKAFTNQNSCFVGNNFSTITEDSQGVLWVGSYWGNDGICYYDEIENDFHCYTTKNSGLAHNTLYKILSGSDGNLWLATQEGLCKLNPITKEFTSYTHNPNDSTTLSHPNVHSIIESKDSLLWLVTACGLNSFDPKTEIFKAYYKSNTELPDNNLYGIEEDNLGNLWISSGKSHLVKFNPKTNKFINYNASDGIQNGDFIKNSSYKSPDGTIYFGGTNGYITLNPNTIKDNSIVPELFFTQLKIFNKVVVPGTVGSPLEYKDINYLDTLTLSYKHSVFTIEYSALNFTFPDKTKFAYKLEGFESEWNFVDNQHSASYTNLDPGTYVFRVKVPYYNGVVNEEGISLTVIITPPFYETLWFKLLVILFIIGNIIGFLYWRVSRIKKINKILEEKVRIRTDEINSQKDLLQKQSDKLLEANAILEERQEQILEQSEELIAQRDELAEVNTVKDRLFSIVAHDLKNPFNTLKGFTELLKRNFLKYDEEKRIMMINHIDSSSTKIYELLEQLLAWSRAQRGIIVFNPALSDIIELIQINLSLVKDQANLKQIKINLSSNKTNISAYFDSDLIHTVIRNLLSNAIKFTPTNGSVDIHVDAGTEKAVVTIRNSGSLINKENLNKLFNDNILYTTSGTQDEKGTGLGLSICKDFISKNNGEIWAESSIEQGTSFSFSLPVNKSGIYNK
jgi:signal transduction histidine kinase/ligand-binding sensor domain-containing protein